MEQAVTEPLHNKKPFPAKVNWLAFWKHRWIVLDMLNQVAHGNWVVAEAAVRLYGGSAHAAYALKRAANDIIDIGQSKAMEADTRTVAELAEMLKDSR